MFESGLGGWPRPVLAVFEIAGAIAIGALVGWILPYLPVQPVLPRDAPVYLVMLVAAMVVAISLPFWAAGVAWSLLRRRPIAGNDLVYFVDGVALAVGLGIGTGYLHIGI